MVDLAADLRPARDLDELVYGLEEPVALVAQVRDVRAAGGFGEPDELVSRRKSSRRVDQGDLVVCQARPALGEGPGAGVHQGGILRGLGLHPPDEFLPLLEESGLIVPVGCWVIREVVRQMQVWQMLYGRDMLEWVSVNVSARQFNDPSLLLATSRNR